MPRPLIFTATFNERGNVEAWVRGSHRACPDADLLVIDDSSPDGTGRLLEEIAQEAPYLRLIHRSEKQGLASAHLMAMRFAQENSYDLLVTMDADGSHQAWQIPELLRAARDVDFVIGTRYRGGHHRAGTGRHADERPGEPLPPPLRPCEYARPRSHDDPELGRLRPSRLPRLRARLHEHERQAFRFSFGSLEEVE